MKKQTLIVLLIMMIMSSTGFQLYAQETSKKVEYDLAKGVKCRVIPTDNGMQLSFNYAKIEYDLKSPRDAASGRSTGKRQHKPFNFIVSSASNSVTEIKSPRDVATGQSSGKVSYSDISIMISSERGSAAQIKPQKITIENDEFMLPPDLADGNYDLTVSWSWGATNSGSAKRCVTSFTITMEGGVAMAISEQGIPSKKK